MHFTCEIHLTSRVPADAPRPAETAAPRLEADLKGLETASDRGVLVGVRGRPYVREGNSGWAVDPSSAATVLQLYRSHGADALGRVAGAFAIVVVDSEAQRVLLAVDRMGMERVAYRVTPEKLVFGNSAELVSRRDASSPAICPDALLDYLVLHMVPAPGSIFRGVSKLQPGHVLAVERGVPTVRRYWPTQRWAQESREGFARWREELHRGLAAAVRRCEPGDATGAFLSGGLDSSTVAGMLSDVVAPAKARTFSIGFGYPEYDELSYARLANDRFGCRAHEYTVTGDDIADGFSRIAAAYDEPFGNSSALPVFYCAKLAREHGVTHLLAGDGGDELFAGNSRYVEQQVFEHYARVPRVVRRALIEPVLRSWPRGLDFWLSRKGRGYVEKANVPLPDRLEMWNLMHRLPADEVLHPDFRAVVRHDHTVAQMRELWNAAPSSSTLGRMLYYDWQYTLADNDLRKVRTMSALAGVHVSFPMLDPDLIDLAMAIPADELMPRGELRGFYKRAMRGYLPDGIIEKKKHGFGLPFGLWLKETPRLRDQIDSNLASLRSRRILQPAFIDRLRDLHSEEDAKYYGVFIWVLAMLEQWFQDHEIAGWQ